MRSLLHVLVLGTLSAVGRADSVVVFNEIHYHPENTLLEYVELHNELSVNIIRASEPLLEPWLFFFFF